MIRIVMKTGHIENVEGGSQSYVMGHEYNVADELGKRLCGSGVSAAVDEGTTLSELYAHETVETAPEHAATIDYSKPHDDDLDQQELTDAKD